MCEINSVDDTFYDRYMLSIENEKRSDFGVKRQQETDNNNNMTTMATAVFVTKQQPTVNIATANFYDCNYFDILVRKKYTVEDADEPRSYPPHTLLLYPAIPQNPGKN
jgi:hypothetical protein